VHLTDCLGHVGLDDRRSNRNTPRHWLSVVAVTSLSIAHVVTGAFHRSVSYIGCAATRRLPEALFDDRDLAIRSKLTVTPSNKPCSPAVERISVSPQQVWCTTQMPAVHVVGVHRRTARLRHRWLDRLSRRRPGQRADGISDHHPPALIARVSLTRRLREPLASDRHLHAGGGLTEVSIQTRTVHSSASAPDKRGRTLALLSALAQPTLTGCCATATGGSIPPVAD
jgi:hypothetical protein